MKGKEIVKGIKDESVKRPQRVVIDEELPDNRFRILVANMKSKAEEPDLMSRRTWGKEVERILKRARLGELLSKKQMREVREGQVFFIRKKRSTHGLQRPNTERWHSSTKTTSNSRASNSPRREIIV